MTNKQFDHCFWAIILGVIGAIFSVTSLVLYGVVSYANNQALAEAARVADAQARKWSECYDDSDFWAFQAEHGGDSYCLRQSKGPMGLWKMEKLK